jgi:hypothetical protein
MPNPKRKKAPQMATSVKACPERKSNGRKSAMDTLLDTMKNVIEDGARGMTPKEREESEKKFNAALDRAVASRKRRRETA